MTSRIKSYKNGECKKKIDKMINNILINLKSGIFQHNKPLEYLEASGSVIELADQGDIYCHELLLYHNQVIEIYIIECKKELHSENEKNLIDKFLSQTEQIIFLIYWMDNIFSFLDRFYTKAITKISLGQYSMDLYKSLFFEEFRNNIFIEVDKLINEERNGFSINGANDKIKSVMKILEEMNFQKPKIVKEGNKIFLVDKSDHINSSQSELKNLWFSEYFIKDTEDFIKTKASNDFKCMSISDYLSTQIKYLEEEKERLKEIIMPIDQEKIDKITTINFQYLFGQFKNEFEFTNERFIKALEEQDNDQLNIMYKISKIFPDYLNIIEEELIKYIKNKCEESFKDGEILKDKNKFLTELVNLRKNINNLICFENDIKIQGIINRAFQSYFMKDKYAKQLSIYVDYYMRKGFKGKSKEEIDNILNDIIIVFSCLNSKLIFQIETVKYMSERLLKKESLSIINEQSFISKLKQEAGVSYVRKMQEILTDLENNKKDAELYKSLEHKGSPNGIKLDITVVSQYAWDINQKYLEKIEIPTFLSSCLDDFKNFFIGKYKDRNLIWYLGLSRLEIQYLYLKDKNISVSTLPQLLSLLLLEEKGELTIGEISQILKCKPNIIISDIQGLIFNPSFNPDSQADKGIITGTFNEESKEFKETDKIIINKNFNNQRLKFSTIPLIKKKSESEQKKEEIQEGEIIKRYQNNILQTTLTRIMKSRIGIETTHEWLVNKTAEQIDLFKAQPQQIKENIEKLIEKNIIKRNGASYEYIA